LKIVYFGTPEFAVIPLNKLIHSPEIKVTAVITQPDKPVGRKKMLTPPPVKMAALTEDIPVHQPKNRKELLETLSKLKADFFIVVAYGEILTEEMLEMPKYGAINLHGSLLPNYRGASPIQESLINGDKETGITVMEMDEDLDQGPIYMMRRITIEENDNAQTLGPKLSAVGAEILPFALQDIVDGVLSPIPQDHSKANYCKKISKEDGEIDFKNHTAEEILNKIRAYTPWPTVYTKIADKKLQIVAAKEAENTIKAGEFEIDGKKLLVGTKKGTLQLEKVKLEGKNEMDSASFINGYKNLII